LKLSEVKMKTKFNKPWLTSYIIKTSKMHKFAKGGEGWEAHVGAKKEGRCGSQGVNACGYVYDNTQ